MATMARICIICENDVQSDNLVEVKKKGFDKLVQVAKQRKLEDLCSNLKNQGIGNIYVHHDCRRKFVDKRKVPDDHVACKKRLRSSVEGKGPFNWKLHCIYCGEEKDEKRSMNEISEVETIAIKQNILRQCDARNDDWGDLVRDRVLPSIDIVADEGFYHRSCMEKFFTIKSGKKVGRPVNEMMEENFHKLCVCLEGESEHEPLLLSEVYAKMVEMSGDPGNCYSSKQLRRKLKERYRDHLIFIEEPGKSSILYFRDFSWFIMNESKKNKSPTASSIMKAAAKIIKSEFREMSSIKSYYPHIEKMADIEYLNKWIPESLRELLKELIPSELKQVSIGQCISQSAKPRSMLAPIPFGIGVDIDRPFGSKWFINHLAKLGFSVSYDEVTNFKKSAASAGGDGDGSPPVVSCSRVEGGAVVEVGSSFEGGPVVKGGGPVEGGGSIVEGGGSVIEGGAPVVIGGGPVEGGGPIVEGSGLVEGGSRIVEGGGPVIEGGGSVKVGPVVEGGGPVIKGCGSVEVGPVVEGGGRVIEGGGSVEVDSVVEGGGPVVEGNVPVQCGPVSEKSSMQKFFEQYAADNMDHNLRTLTGKGTFHGMGIISMSANDTKTIKAIRRLKKNEKKQTTGSVPIIPYFGSHERGLSKLRFNKIKHLSENFKDDDKHHCQEKTIDLVWQLAWHFSTRQSPRPNWQGFMQTAAVPENSDNPVSKSSIKYLPIIDLNPSDETCLYSTLLFVQEEAKKQNIEVPCITFDQPLWQKAVGIIQDKNLDIVCRLGGFHTLMSFLSSIGKLMMGSGIEELFEEVYAGDTVKHMIAGKAYARALRAHLMAQSILVEHLVEIMEEEGKLPPMADFESCYSKLLNGALTAEDLVEFSNGKHTTSFENEMKKLTGRLTESRTAKLWIQYINYINIIKDYIIAERTSDWNFHLKTLSKMLNLFAATGHVNYARSARMYIQQMLQLETKYPYLFDKFSAGHHAVRRSNRYWAGLWSDLIIEQTLMRSVKSQGGLTRGRGMEENVRQLWISSMSYCAAVHYSMTTLTGVKVTSSDQHQEMGYSRIKTDYEDSLKLFCWLEKRNPFIYKDQHLHSLSSGVVSMKGKDNVNCDEAEVVGEKIQETIDGKLFTNAKIKRKDEAKSLAVIQNTITVDDEPIAVDSTSLFTRLAAVAQREEYVEKYFEYELTQFPESLFNRGLVRKPDKASLRKVILPEQQFCHPMSNGQFVLDGGALLHRVSWKKGMTFSEIASYHVSYVRAKYGTCHVVFDGYNSPFSIKSNEHERRKKTHGSCPEVEILDDNESKYNRERFLSNWKNKQQLIALIAEYLTRDGQSIHVCEGDADTKIVSTALELSKREATTVVADNTDVAVMLAYHWNTDLKSLIFLSERAKKCWDIGDCQKELDGNKEHLLFIHAWTGCDSTSATCGKGKVSFLNLIKKSEILVKASEVITDFCSTEEEIKTVSIQAFQELYGGNLDTSLSTLRYNKYLEMLCRGVIQPERLPPTADAAIQHGARVHLQVIQWKMLDENVLDPTEWGWKSSDTGLRPIKTTKAVAPPEILKIIKCNCSLSSKNPCGTNLCSCRKNGIQCMPACGNCHGSDCNNRTVKTNHQCEEIWDNETTDQTQDETSNSSDYDDRNIFDLFD